MSKIISFWDTNADDNFFESLEKKQKTLGELFDNDDPSEPTSATMKYSSVKSATTSSMRPGQFNVEDESVDDIFKPKHNTNITQNTHNVEVETSAPTKVTWLTQIAKVVNAYKNDKAVGKVGVALLKNASNNCKIVLYRTKTKMLATFSICLNSANSQLHHQSNYLQFYDDNSVYWSLLFDNSADEYEFIQKLSEYGIKVRQESERSTENSVRQKTKRTSNAGLTNLKGEGDENTHDVVNTEQDQKSKFDNVVQSLQIHMSKFEGGNIERSDAPIVNKSQSHILSTTTIIPNEAKSQILHQYGIDNHSTNKTMESQFLQILLSENRTQNTELRMNITKLENKVEKLMETLSTINSSAIKHNIKDNDVLDLEERILTLKKENRKLKLEIDDRIEANKIEDLQKALRFHKDDLDMLGLSSVIDVDTLVAGLIDKTTKYLGDLAKSEVLKNQYIEEKQLLQEKLKAEQEHNKKIQQRLQQVETTNNALVLTIDEKNKQLRCIQQEYDDINKSFNNTTSQYKLQTEVTIKTIMNNLYSNLTSQIDNLGRVNKNEILSIIGRTIRDETLEAVEQIKQMK